MAIPALAPVERPLLSSEGGGVAVGEEVAVGELDDDTIWLTKLTTEDKDVDVGVAVVPI